MPGERSPLRIAMLGTRGVPASYSGFETCAEELGARLAARGHAVTVYCRVPHIAYPGRSYRGMRLVKLPTIRAKHLDTIAHAFASSLHALVGPLQRRSLFQRGHEPRVLDPAHRGAARRAERRRARLEAREVGPRRALVHPRVRALGGAMRRARGDGFTARAAVLSRAARDRVGVHRVRRRAHRRRRPARTCAGTVSSPAATRSSSAASCRRTARTTWSRRGAGSPRT